MRDGMRFNFCVWEITQLDDLEIPIGFCSDKKETESKLCYCDDWRRYLSPGLISLKLRW